LGQSGNERGQADLRIHQHRGVCLAWREGNANAVEIVDDQTRRNNEGEKLLWKIIEADGHQSVSTGERIHAPARRIREMALETGVSQQIQPCGCQNISKILPNAG
jgi:hypothetical protein